MKFKTCLLLILALALLGCDANKVAEDVCEVCGNYYFRYIDKTSVSFCGWTREAIEELDGDMYVPEKIYNLNVVEIRNINKIKTLTFPYYDEIKDGMKGVKSVVIPETVKRINSAGLTGDDLKLVTFKDTSNWYKKTSSDTQWTPIDVSNPSNNVLVIKNAGSLKNIP